MDAHRWMPVFALVFLAGLLLRLPFLTGLGSALLVVFGLAAWWRSKVLDQVIYQRRFFFTRAFPDEYVPVNLLIENHKLLPVSWLRVIDPWPKAVGPVDEAELAPSHLPDQGYLTSLFSLRWYERVRRSHQLIFRKRGVYTVGPASLESGDLFGLYQISKTESNPQKLTVFPRLISLPEPGLPAENPVGERRSRRRLLEDPNRPMGTREYQPEDSFRRIHWPATARTGELQVKVYTPTSAPVVVLCLNISTSARYWEGIYPDLLEQLVSLTATLASKAVEQGFRVGLIANGCLANSDQPFRIAPGSATRQLARLLEALAGVTAITTAPFERFLLREASRLPYGATLVVITAVTNPELNETLLKLKRHERQIVLVALAADPPGRLPGIQVIHQPYHPEQNNPVIQLALSSSHASRNTNR